MIRLYVPEGERITPAQEHYVRRVMRRDVTSTIYCFNETGEWLCQADGRRIHKTREPIHLPERTIGIGCIKKVRLEWLVEKLTEIGITRLQLLQTDYSQPQLYDFNRLRKITIEATEQSGHLTPMVIGGPIPLETFLQVQNISFCHPGALESQNYFNTIVIGPEGGWSPREIAFARNQISLGSMILRSETAAILAGFLLVSGYGESAVR